MTQRQIKYTQKSFDEIRSEIEQYAKQYFPEYFSSFKDPNSFERLVSEIVAMQSDVLHFYLNDSVKQLLQKYATDAPSVYRNAKMRGYKPQTVTVAVGSVQLSQLVPAILSGSVFVPNTASAGYISAGSSFANTTGEVRYFTTDDCNMKFYEDVKLEVTSSLGGQPEYFRIYKTVPVRSGQRKIKTVTIDEPVPFRRILLDSNVAFVESVVDSDNNTWFEVEYLAQDMIFDSLENNGSISEYSAYINETPNILKKRKISRRFITDHMSNGNCYLEFGNGSDIIDNELTEISAYDFLTNNQLASLQISDSAIADNFLNSDSFGLTPSNTILTITYITSAGETENAKENDIVQVLNLNVTYDAEVNDTISNSWSVSNREPVLGAEFKGDLDKIKYESYQVFSSQRRCVTEKDFAIRAKMLPARYGSISKVFVEKDTRLKMDSADVINQLNMYVLGMDNTGYLKQCNDLTKRNLITYLNEFRLAGITINVLNAYIINFGVNFEFSVKRNYDKNTVKLKISEYIKNYFNIKKWEINQPISVDDLKYNLLLLDGVLSINKLEFFPLYNSSEGYSNVYYDMSYTGENYDPKMNLILPPADIGIFELKYDKDIRGKNV